MDKFRKRLKSLNKPEKKSKPKPNILLYTAACGKKYFKHVKALLASNIAHSKLPALVYTINCDEKLGSCRHVNEDIEGFKNAHMVCKRFEYLYRYLKENKQYEYILFLDADSLILKEISIDFGDFDVCCHLRDHEDKRKVLNSTIIFRVSDKIINMLQAMCHFMRSKNYKWYADQLAFLHCLGMVNVKQLPLSYIDYFLNDNSAIWSGKGSSSSRAKYKKKKRYYGQIQKTT